MSEWQPIETAPKDGAHILVAFGPFSQHWGFNQSPPCVVHWWPHEGEEGWYYSRGLNAENDSPLSPTHWMPLPLAPDVMDEGEG